MTADGSSAPTEWQLISSSCIFDLNASDAPMIDRPAVDSESWSRKDDVIGQSRGSGSSV